MDHYYFITTSVFLKLDIQTSDLILKDNNNMLGQLISYHFLNFPNHKH